MIDPALVTALIRETAEAVILPRFRALAPGEIREKKPGDFVTVADTEAEAMLSRRLVQALPGSTVCGEEGVAGDRGVLAVLDGAAPVWVIDPVDGTCNFAHGRTGFAVIVALVEAGIVRAGWIHEPLTGVTVHAVRGGGAWHEGRRLTVDRSRPLSAQSGSAYGRLDGRGEACRLLTAAGAVAGVRNTGCGGIDYILMARGETQFKYSSASLPWDHAAGILIMDEAGAVARFADGAAYNVHRHASPLLIAPDPASWQALQHLLTGATITPENC
ncbi:MAG: inositol monophosphatase [Rhodospirillaceae bacterium]